MKETEKELVDKCLLGHEYDHKRGEACWKLAKECHSEMKQAGAIERGIVRRRLLDEITPVNKIDTLGLDEPHYIPLEGIEEPREVPRVFTEEAIYHPVGDDTSMVLIDNLIKKPFSTCSIALLGIETQMYEQVSSAVFQSIMNSKEAKKIDGIIFDEGVKYNKESDDISYSQSPKDIKYDVCNKIINPKVMGDYQTCSEANLAGFTDLVLKKAIVSTAGIKCKSFDDLSGIPMSQIWDAITDETKLKILKKANMEHKDIKENYLANTEKIMNDIRTGIVDNYSEKEIVSMVKQRIEHGVYEEVGREECWHDVLGRISYSDEYDRATQKVYDDFQEKKIDLKEAERQLKDIAKRAGNFKIKVAGEELPADEPLEVGRARPAIYKPIRLRLWGSQHALNQLYNQTLMDLPLDEFVIPNAVTRRAAIRGLDSLSTRQLERNLILDIKLTGERVTYLIDNYDADKIWDTIQPLSFEHSAELIGEELWQAIREEYLTNKYRALLGELDIGWEEWKDDYVYFIDDYDTEECYPPSPYVEIGYSSDSYEDAWEEKENIYEYMEHINKEYPELTKDDVGYILRADNAETWGFFHEFAWSILMSLKDLTNYVDKILKEVTDEDKRTLIKEKYLAVAKEAKSV